MSGPIVRKYGFPNFEKIFGKRELEHGVDDAEQSEPASKPREERRLPQLPRRISPKGSWKGEFRNPEP